MACGGADRKRDWGYCSLPPGREKDASHSAARLPWVSTARARAPWRYRWLRLDPGLIFLLERKRLPDCLPVLELPVVSTCAQSLFFFKLSNVEWIKSVIWLLMRGMRSSRLDRTGLAESADIWLPADLYQSHRGCKSLHFFTIITDAESCTLAGC